MPPVNPLKPDVTLLMKLGSALVHADEMLGAHGHDFDRVALRTLLDDPDVQAWVREMGALLPVKRT